MGRHCSCLLPKQTGAGGTTQILIFKTLRTIGRPTLYVVAFGRLLGKSVHKVGFLWNLSSGIWCSWKRRGVYFALAGILYSQTTLSGVKVLTFMAYGVSNDTSAIMVVSTVFHN